ncbi:hypothetical protein EDB80DRAFT_80444 [Ilyonectria destructans]|nr:hypothetical protein EDB80DRAFT_80444 [Ilyonectria destructans]
MARPRPLLSKGLSPNDQLDDTGSVAPRRPPPSNDDPSRSITACQRCRDHKLKCSRGRPICVRCRRLHADCFYPPPTDRKRSRIEHNPTQPARPAHLRTSRKLAASKTSQSVSAAQHKDRNFSLEGIQPSSRSTPISFDSSAMSIDDVEHRSSADPPQHHIMTESLADISSTPYSVHLRNDHQTSTPVGVNQDAGSSALPPRVAGLLLLEIYFSRVYNAHLLFHKPLLFQEYIEDKLPDYLLKAIFALASLFLAPSKSRTRLRSTEFSELEALSVFHNRSLPWAEASMKETMLLTVRELSLTMIQTLECLVLYWFGVGKSRNGDICLVLAHRSCFLLQYGQSGVKKNGESQSEIESELKRRCQWATWASMCIAAQPQAHLRSAWSEVANVPLPGRIRNSPNGWQVTVGQHMNADWQRICLNDCEATSSQPVVAMVMRVVGIWAKVQLFGSESSTLLPNQRFETLSDLSERLESLWDERPQSNPVAWKSPNVSESVDQLLLFDGLHHMCKMTLHSTLVPLFSGSPKDPSMDVGLVQKSAKSVLRYADLFVALLRPYYNGDYDVTSISPHLAYGAFMTGVVLLSFEMSTRNNPTTGPQISCEVHVQNGRISHVKDIVRLLGVLCSHWNVLHSAFEKLREALKAVTSSIEPELKTQTPVNSNRMDNEEQAVDTANNVEVGLISPSNSQNTTSGSFNHQEVQSVSGSAVIHWPLNQDMPEIQPPVDSSAPLMVQNQSPHDPTEAISMESESLYGSSECDWWNTIIPDMGLVQANEFGAGFSFFS